MYSLLNPKYRCTYFKKQFFYSETSLDAKVVKLQGHDEHCHDFFWILFFIKFDIYISIVVINFANMIVDFIN